MYTRSTKIRLRPGSYKLCKVIQVYKACMNIILNWSSVLQHFKWSNPTKITNGIMFNFYSGLPQLNGVESKTCMKLLVAKGGWLPTHEIMRSCFLLFSYQWHQNSDCWGSSSSRFPASLHCAVAYLCVTCNFTGWSFSSGSGRRSTRQWLKPVPSWKATKSLQEDTSHVITLLC